MKLEFWNWKNLEWQDTWDTTQSDGQRGMLPSRVRITVTLKSPEGNDIKLVTQARIMMQEPLNFVHEALPQRHDERRASRASASSASSAASRCVTVMIAIAITLVISNEFGTSTTTDMIAAANYRDQMRAHFLARSRDRTSPSS